MWAERQAEGGAVWRRKQARPGGGSPGRTMDSQGRKVVVCDNGTGVRLGGAAACVSRGARGPLGCEAGLRGCGQARGRALGGRGCAGGPSRGAGWPALSRWPGARLPAVHPKVAEPARSIRPRPEMWG